MPSGPALDLHDLIACADFAFLENAEIKAGPAMRDEQCCHLRLVHADADPIAGDARLRYLEQGIADPVLVADAHFRTRQSLDSKILLELAMGKVAATKAILPIAVGVDLIDKDGPVFATMPGQI